MSIKLCSFSSSVFPLTSISDQYVQVDRGQNLTVKSTEYRVVFFLGDSIRMSVKDGPSFDIMSGDACAIGPNIEVEYSPVPGVRQAQNHVLVVRLSRDLLDDHAYMKLEHKGGTWAPFLLQLKPSFDVKHFPQLLKEEGAREVVQLIRVHLNGSGSSADWKVSSLCYALLAYLPDNQCAEVNRAASIDRGAASVRHACHYIQEHFKEKLTLSAIAWAVQLSGEHLERLFKKHLGITVFEYLHRQRIGEVKKLLQTTDWSVAQIAQASGYSSSNLLGRHFKSRTGMTAVAYRMDTRKREILSPSKIDETGHELVSQYQ